MKMEFCCGKKMLQMNRPSCCPSLAQKKVTSFWQNSNSATGEVIVFCCYPQIKPFCGNFM